MEKSMFSGVSSLPIEFLDCETPLNIRPFCFSICYDDFPGAERQFALMNFAICECELCDLIQFYAVLGL